MSASQSFIWVREDSFRKLTVSITSHFGTHHQKALVSAVLQLSLVKFWRQIFFLVILQSHQGAQLDQMDCMLTQ